MSRTGAAITVVLAVGSGVGSFLATRSLGFAQLTTGVAASRPGDEAPLMRYLGLSNQQAQTVRQADPDFDAEAAVLAATLTAERQGLITLLENPSTPDEQIMTQVEKVIAAHNALGRRAAEHLLAIRPHLTPEQQKRLMSLAARSVRAAGRRRDPAPTQGPSEK